MRANHSNIQPQPQIRKGWAIASLVLGVISIPTLGLLVAGAITAIAFGVIALGRIKKEPAAYGGKGMAIAGIITGAASLLPIAIFTLLTPVATPIWVKRLRNDRETQAIQNLKIIHDGQASFYLTKQRFGALKELGEAGYLRPNYVNGGAVGGYIYVSAPEVGQDKYCVQAYRESSSIASKDFNIGQDGVIRYVESQTPRPIACNEGVPITGAQ
jgi:hypothetical protein